MTRFMRMYGAKRFTHFFVLDYSISFFIFITISAFNYIIVILFLFWLLSLSGC
jgi:hypothetical protein